MPSTIIKLETALIKVSMLLTVKDIDKMIIIIAIGTAWSLSNNVKKAKSGITFEFCDTETNPEKPIKKTIGIIIKKEKIKLFFKILLLFAA